MSKALDQAESTLAAVRDLLDDCRTHYAALCAPEGRVSVVEMDRHQVALYEYAWLETQLAAAEQFLAYARRLPDSGRAPVRLGRELALLFAAATVWRTSHTLMFREAEFGLTAHDVEVKLGNAAAARFAAYTLSAGNREAAAGLLEETGGAVEEELTGEHRALRDAFRRFGAEKIAPFAETIHREDTLLPDTLIAELGQVGCFGLSIPEKYGGFQDDERPDHLAMVIASDELSRASFGTAGSLITRPELLSKALLRGGTEAQKAKWLPLIASGARQVAVAVTEPDYGSDVAHLTTSARPVEGGWRLNGTKMWCTYAGRADLLMVLARTDPDRSQGHRGLSLFIIEKPASDGHSFEVRANGGRLSGRAIATLGYRGMHSFEVVFEDVFVPAENLIGESSGLGRGFYLQMYGFGGSRLQTAGRALGIMSAAFAEALSYVRQRTVFGRALIAYPLVRHKLVQMAMQLEAARQLTYSAARQVDQGDGAVAAAMAKLLTARFAERITREAQQLHGGMGYAEEFPVSRHFVDARVLAIFEGAEEVLALRVIARSLLAGGTF